VVDFAIHQFLFIVYRMVRVEIESVDLALAVGIFILKEGKTIKHCENDDDDTNIRIERIESRQEDGTRLACMPGLGSTRFAYDGKIYTFERTSTGPPVSASVSDRVAAMYECATLSGQNESDVRKFCELAIQNQENDIENHYQTFTWKAQHEYWKRASFSLNRNFESRASSILQQGDIGTIFLAMIWCRGFHFKVLYRNRSLFSPPGYTQVCDL
jgi:hypothetical protein